MFIGYFIIGFMLGFIIGVGGGYKLAKRAEIRYVQQAIRDQTPLDGFKTAKATQGRDQDRYPADDFYDSVPDSWREES